MTKRDERAAGNDRRAGPERGAKSPAPEDLVTCDQCGEEAPRDVAITSDIDGETVIFCGPACHARRIELELDRGPESDDRQGPSA